MDEILDYFQSVITDTFYNRNILVVLVTPDKQLVLPTCGNECNAIIYRAQEEERDNRLQAVLLSEYGLRTSFQQYQTWKDHGDYLLVEVYLLAHNMDELQSEEEFDNAQGSLQRESDGSLYLKTESIPSKFKLVASERVEHLLSISTTVSDVRDGV